jgi:hypothetical protein
LNPPISELKEASGSDQRQAAQPKLAWPPTKEDLQRLYVDEKLSAAKVAIVYGLNTPNPRSATFLVAYHLKKHGITMRSRVEELRKETEKVVAAWKAKYPKKEGGDVSSPVEERGFSDKPVRLTAEEKAVVELLQYKNLSIRHLDPETKGRVKAAMDGLHWTRELSLNDIADLVGNKTSGYSSYLFKELGIEARPFEEARLKGIHEKVRKYERKPFDGTDEDKAYMLGLKHGDLYAYNPFGDAVRVSTSTTHPALANLFTELFGRYGHVDRYPRYKEDTKTYEWNFQAILDKSFEFLVEPRDKCREWVARKDSTMLSYLAGLIDAEGHIEIHPNPRTTAITVSVWNTDTGLLGFSYRCLEQLGHKPLEPYLQSSPGPISSGFRIERKKAYWRVLVARFDEAQTLLRRLPLRHSEKVAARELALTVSKGDLFDGIADKVSSLRKSFKQDARRYVKQAEREFLRTHPVPTNPVLCFLQREAGHLGLDEHYERRLLSLQGYLAIHDGELCQQEDACVMICPGCDEENIVPVLVHESIHHALMWMSENILSPKDPLDRIVRVMHRRGLTEQGFESYG